ncbi:GNAT family N-acetyltransferase [Malikia sp.]|uniref:GNAT family N-acetyltransferase n=1 Tax=Malikia sp. TaxID=2070706 RepID=UPI002620DD8A|nr:GNAT family N-acetyltransferase [Malikia sp.]MDD2728893.1 GNAT family N-acetyltransferase [Malikia sp.]
MNIVIRDAGPDDAAGIVAIYNEAVAHGTAIWNERRVDVADRLAWIAARQAAGWPVLVALDPQGQLLGYGSFADFRAFDGYRHTVEHSVYVRADCRGAGLGAALLLALVERAKAAGKHAMVAAIEAGNTASLRLHARCGFEPAGTLRQVGAKFGRWLDLSFMQRLLDELPPR